MEFYYKDKLIRTSKTHNYTHAVMTADDKLVACASSYQLAEKSMISNTVSERSNLEYYKAEVNAMKNGKEEFWYKNKKRKVGRFSIDTLEKTINQYENYLKGLHIVELKSV